MKLSALAVLMFAACAASQSSPVRPWRVELRTSGGIAGKGVGTYSIDSTGNVEIVSMNGKSCTFQVKADELSRIEHLIADAKPESWNPSYAPENRCCDRIEYTLTVDQAGTKRTVEWIDDPLPLPDDLTKLAAALIGGEKSLRTEYGELCR